MRNIQYESAERIRVLLLCADSDLKQEVEQNFLHAGASQIHLVESTSYLEECRTLIQKIFPHVVALVDIEQEPQWSASIFQLCRDLQQEQPEIATVLVTDQLQLDTAYYQRAMAAGVHGVIGAERLIAGKIAPLFRTLEGSILQAYQSTIARLGHGSATRKRFLPTTITLISGKGGVGKSIVTTAIASEILRRQPGKKLVIVDLDLQFGTVAPILGLLKPDRTLAQLLEMKLSQNPRIDVQAYLPKRQVGPTSMIYIVAAPQLPTDLHALAPDECAAILGALRRTFDYILIDLPSQITDATVVALQASDHVIHICEPELLSIRATRQLQKVMITHDYLSAPAAQSHIVLNKVTKERMIPAHDVEQLFADQLLTRLPLDTQYIEEHINRGEPIGQIAPTRKHGAEFMKALGLLCDGLEILAPTAIPIRNHKPLDRKVSKHGQVQGMKAIKKTGQKSAKLATREKAMSKAGIFGRLKGAVFASSR